jgi:cytochrome c553
MPKGTKIKALRIYQAFPLSLAARHIEHNIGLQIPGSMSVNVARAVLGTVPVEEDGSAFFIAPARRELFFQALDENGMAVQTMRSGTHFMPGENTTCLGCHEPSHSTAAPAGRVGVLLAMRRAPSRLKQDVDGTNPFSYPRLVQPVLDKNCVACHAKEKNKDKAPRLDSGLVKGRGGGWMNIPTTYFASYLSLTPKYGTWRYSLGSRNERNDDLRSTPGKVGAKASKLYEMLRKGHHDVKLSDEDMHRLIVWLDSYSPFYGVYEPEGGKAQLRGEVVHPTLE